MIEKLSKTRGNLRYCLATLLAVHQAYIAATRLSEGEWDDEVELSAVILDAVRDALDGIDTLIETEEQIASSKDPQ